MTIQNQEPNNLTYDQKLELLNLKSDEQITVKQSDKGEKLVVIDVNQYKKMCLTSYVTKIGIFLSNLPLLIKPINSFMIWLTQLTARGLSLWEFVRYGNLLYQNSHAF